MKIRKARINDFELIKNLMLTALKSDPSAFVGEYDEYNSSSDSWWKLYLNDYLIGIHSNLFFYLNEKSEPIGMIGVTFNKRKRLSHVATIVWFYVLPEYRKNGIGKELILFLIDHLNNLSHIRKVSLTVISSQEKAIAMYKQNSFKIVGTQKKEIQFEDSFFDFITMERELEAK